MDNAGSIEALDEDLYLMTNVWPEDSGLPFVVWISPKQSPHDVRVKVSASTKPLPTVASVSVRPEIEVVAGKLSNRDLALVRQWIELNRQVILDHWEGKMPSSRAALEALKPLPKP